MCAGIAWNAAAARACLPRGKSWHNCSNCMPGLVRARVVICPKPVFSRTIRPCGRRLPRPRKIAWAWNAPSTTTALWSRPASVPRKLIWSWSTTTCCLPTRPSRRKASGKSCPVPTALFWTRPICCRNWRRSSLVRCCRPDSCRNWPATVWPSVSKSVAPRPCCRNRPGFWNRPCGICVWPWIPCRPKAALRCWNAKRRSGLPSRTCVRPLRAWSRCWKVWPNAVSAWATAMPVVWNW